MSTDVYPPEKRSAVMRAVKSTNTTPELAVRKIIWAQGYRYRLNVRALPGAPDIVLSSRKAVILVHGCFWHGHDCARGARIPKANRAYWQQKIARNRARDERHGAALAGEGWRVLTIWECDLKEEAALQRRLRFFLK